MWMVRNRSKQDESEVDTMKEMKRRDEDGEIKIQPEVP
jgi:hypothetical protein